MAVTVSATVAQEVASVPKETAQILGKLMTQTAADIEKPQVKIAGDPAKTVAVAVLDVEGGIFLVPQKGLDEENLPDMTAKNGVPLGLFFSSSNLVPAPTAS